MKLARRSWLQAGLALPLLGRSAFAQSFPENRPIHWVVPFPPGGQTDSTARLTAQGLAAALPAYGTTRLKTVDALRRIG